MTIQKIDHLAVLVGDMDTAIAHWQDKLGLEFDKRLAHEGLGMDQAIMNMPGGGFIELISPLNDDSPIAKMLEDQGQGFAGLSFEVDSIEKTVKEFEEKGVRTFVQGGATFIHPRETNGLMISLMEKSK